MNKVSLLTICDGSAPERFDYELQKVLDNIIDPNTDAKAPREITLTVKIVADENRETFKPKMFVKSKLARLTPVTSICMLEKNVDGHAEAHEYSKPKQQEFTFDDKVTRIVPARSSVSATK